MSVMADPYFETFKDTAGHWRWRLKAGNGRKIATAGEWFTRREDATRAARGVQQTAPLAQVRVPIVKATARQKAATPQQSAALAAALRAATRGKRT
jgi:uncharacterized protein YegP (UPF0339 family)